MINIEKQIQHWREGSKEEWEVASELVANKRIRHGLFLAHLAAEKLLKAHVCKQTNDIAPRIHNLVRFSEIASLQMSSEQLSFLAKLNKYNIEGRYSEFMVEIPDLKTTKKIMSRTEEILQWLNRTL